MNRRLEFSDTVTQALASVFPIDPPLFLERTPLRNEIEKRDADLLNHATDIATAAIAKQFGSG